MKNKNFQRSNSVSDDGGLRIKKSDPSSSKEKKNFKKKIYDEIDEFEDIDLYGTNQALFDEDESERKFDGDEDDSEI